MNVSVLVDNDVDNNKNQQEDKHNMTNSKVYALNSIIDLFNLFINIINFKINNLNNLKNIKLNKKHNNYFNPPIFSIPKDIRNKTNYTNL